MVAAINGLVPTKHYAPFTIVCFDIKTVLRTLRATEGAGSRSLQYAAGTPLILHCMSPSHVAQGAGSRSALQLAPL